MTAIRQAPLLGTTFKKDIASVKLDATDQGTFVRLAWSGVIFDAGYTPIFLVVGKEYGTDATRYHDIAEVPKECAGQTLHCVPDPDTVQPVGYPHDCWSGIHDSMIAQQTVGLGSAGTMDVPYNKFMLQANACAFQTDGDTDQYFMEFSAFNYNTKQTQKIKFLFDFTTPEQEITNPCGAGEVVVPPSPVPPVPATPGKGQGNKPVKKN